MNLKRAFSNYAPLAFLAIVAGILTYYVSKEFCGRWGMSGNLTWIIFGGVLLLGGLFSVLIIYLHKKVPLDFLKNLKIPSYVWHLLEGITFLGIMTGGLLVRQRALQGIGLEILKYDYPISGDLFRQAMVTANGELPGFLVGAEDLYLRMLRMICFVFGNSRQICVKFQMVSCLIACIPWYFGVRHLTGRIPAIVFLVQFCFHPMIVAKSVCLSAEGLIFFILGVELWLMATMTKREKENIFLCVLAGLWTGFAVFSDVFGAVFFLLAIVFCLRMKKSEKRNVIPIVVYFACMAIGTLACIAVNAVLSGESFGTKWSRFLGQFSPDGLWNLSFSEFIEWWFMGYFVTDAFLVVAVMLIMACVCCVFYQSIKELILPWIAFLFVALVFMILQIPHVIGMISYGSFGEPLQDFLEMPFSGSLFSMSCLFVIAGIGVLALVRPGELTLNVYSKAEKAEASKENVKARTADNSFRYEPLYERTPVKKEETPDKAKPLEDGVKQLEVKEMVLKEEPLKEGPVKEETIKEVALKEIDQAMVKDGQEGQKML